jgi:hypothetical protein
MKVSISDAAYAKIIDVAEFIDDINTPGAGDRWITKTMEFIEEYARLKQVRWSLCRNNYLAAMEYNCLIYKNWVIAFKIERGKFMVYDFIYGSLLE